MKIVGRYDGEPMALYEKLHTIVDSLSFSTVDGVQYFVAFARHGGAHNDAANHPGVTVLPHPHSPAKLEKHHIKALAHLDVMPHHSAHEAHLAVHRHVKAHDFHPDVQ